jgi:hypothetical protein
MRQIKIVQRLYDAFGDGDLDTATAVFADRVRMTDPGLGVVEGLAALPDYLDGLKGPTPGCAGDHRSGSMAKTRASRQRSPVA